MLNAYNAVAPLLLGERIRLARVQGKGLRSSHELCSNPEKMGKGDLELWRDFAKKSTTCDLA
jgi:hypothetical protein